MSVFNTTQTHGGSFSANQSRLVFQGLAAGHLTQNVNFTYTQQVGMLYELGSSQVFYIGGRSQGQASLARVVGPAAGLSLLQLYQDICRPGDITIAMQTGCGSTTKVAAYVLQSAVLTSLGGSQTSQDVIFNENMQFMFLNLAVS